jgi:hypothetical protein
MRHVSGPGLEVLKRKIIHRSQLKPTNQQLLGCTDEHRVSAETADGTPASLMAESTGSEDETDWESDIDRCEHLQIFSHEYSKGLENEHSLAGPFISLFKSKLVDRIMQEFWLIFNQDWTSNLRQCNPSNSGSGPGTTSQETFKSSTDNGSLKDGSNQTYNQDTTSKRSRQYGDDPPSDEDDGIGPRLPRRVSRSPENGHDGRKFACPYRKHNRRKYCLPNWRTCALTPQVTVARLKFVTLALAIT